MKKTLNLFLAIAFALGIPLSAFGENILVLGAGITQGTADSLYLSRLGDEATGVSKGWTFNYEGLPMTVANTTDSADLELLKLSHAQTPYGGDGNVGRVLFEFTDEEGDLRIPLQIWAVMSDANPKGGTDGQWDFYTNSITPALMFTINGVSDSVMCDLYAGLGDAFDSGMRIGDGLILFETSGTPRFEINEAGGYYRGVGLGAIIDGRLAVNTTIGALDGSVLAGFVSTTQGTIPAPKMTSTQRDNIGTPDEGLFVYDLTNNVPNFYNGTGFRAFLHIAATSLTNGSVPFADSASSLAQDNANFFWDDTDNQLGIGTNTPDDSAILDVASTTAGILPPRMTTAQLGAISSPATGLFGFNTTTGTPQYYDSSAWVNFAGPATKAGVKTSGSFSGNPQTVTVTFNTAFPDANYSVSINGSDVRDWSVDSQVAASFVINSNAAQALSASVYWTAIAHYDP